MTAIPPANPALLPSDGRLIDRWKFERAHPFLVSDGRRFCSLETAADTAYGMPPGTTVTDASGRLYTWDDCRRIACRDRKTIAA